MTDGPIRDLADLLKAMTVTPLDGEWTFVTSAERFTEGTDIMSFREREGWTHILPTDASTPEDQRFVWLEISVHSDLNAVGFLAALSNRLAEAGVPCNAVAGYYHDHIFVPTGLKSKALDALNSLAG